MFVTPVGWVDQKLNLSPPSYYGGYSWGLSILLSEIQVLTLNDLSYSVCRVDAKEWQITWALRERVFFQFLSLNVWNEKTGNNLTHMRTPRIPSSHHCDDLTVTLVSALFHKQKEWLTKQRTMAESTKHRLCNRPVPSWYLQIQLMEARQLHRLTTQTLLSRGSLCLV